MRILQCVLFDFRKISITTRIKTLDGLYGVRPVGVFRKISITTRIKTHVTIGKSFISYRPFERFPLQQGSRQRSSNDGIPFYPILSKDFHYNKDQDELDFTLLGSTTSFERFPLQQGLRHSSRGHFILAETPYERFPLQQGSKKPTPNPSPREGRKGVG